MAACTAHTTFPFPRQTILMTRFGSCCVARTQLIFVYMGLRGNVACLSESNRGASMNAGTIHGDEGHNHPHDGNTLIRALRHSPMGATALAARKTGFRKLSVRSLLLASTALMVTLSQEAMADEIIDGVRTVTTNETYSGKIFIGHTAAGELTISGGGTVNNSEENTIGYNSGVSGKVTVTGTGSEWTTAHDNVIGGFGTSELRVENGGAVYDRNGTVGYAVGGTGSVTITGADSK